VEPRPVAAVRDLPVGGEVLAIRERSAAAVEELIARLIEQTVAGLGANRSLDRPRTGRS